MIMERRDAAYLLAVLDALEAGTLAASELTAVCPECTTTLTYRDSIDHLLVQVGVSATDVAVVISCEGYWVVNPALVGVDAPNWQDWRQA